MDNEIKDNLKRRDLIIIHFQLSIFSLVKWHFYHLCFKQGIADADIYIVS